MMNADSQTVVITGVASSTCCGVGVKRFFESLAQGFNNNRSRQATDSSQQSGPRKFSKISHDVRELLRKTRTDNLLTHHLIAAVDCDLGAQIRAWQPATRARVGVALGNSSGNFKPYFKYFATATQEGHQFVNPIHFPATLLNYSTVQFNNAFSLKGSSTTISSGFAAGLDAIGYAVLALQLGREQIMFAGGIEEINDYNLSFMKGVEANSSSARLRSFGKYNDGVVPGEGVGILMLETKDSAEAAGRECLGEIRGYCQNNGRIGESNDALIEKVHKVTGQVMKNANLYPEEIDAIFPSVNGSGLCDEFERKVLEKAFGAALYQIPIYPIKSIIGECFTASGPLQCIAAVYAMTRAGINHESPKSMSKSDGLYQPRQINRCKNVLVYSFGLDRSFSALVLSGTN